MTDFNINTKSYFFGLFKAETKSAVPAKSGGQKSVITQLITEFQDRSRSSIIKWREALQAAEDPEDPRWSLLQDLYENLMTDGHLMANIQIRKAAVLSTRFYIQDKNGKENEETTAQLQTEWFYNLMDMMLDAVYNKVTVVELIDPATMTFNLIPRRNICPQLQRVYFEVYGTKYITYTDPAFLKNIIWVNDISKFGLLNDIVPQLIWKRNAQQTWADFAERFGIPMVTAETLETDPKKLDKIDADLKKVGQAMTALLPEGTKITIYDSATKGDPHKIFMEQIKVTNNEMSKRIVGGTMLSEDGSSLSQSEVHERTLDSKIAEADRRMLEFTITAKVMPMLRNWGLKFADGDRFVFDRTESLTLTDQWTIVKGILEGHDVDSEWLSRNFNVPIIGKKQTTPTPPVPGKGLTANFQ